MQKILFFLVLTFSWHSFVFGQLQKEERPNVYYQADIYTDDNGDRFSNLINIKFNQRFMDLPKGVEETNLTVMQESSLKTLLQDIEKKYGSFKLRKVFPTAIWGDTKRINKRSGMWVSISERSQVFEIIFDKPQPIDEIIAELKQNKSVEYVEGPAVFVTALEPDDYYFQNGTQWELDAIDAEKAWDITTGSCNAPLKSRQFLC